jgi:hypothetical protein
MILHSGFENFMSDLTTLANLAEIFGAVVVVGGLAFAVVQLHNYRQQRRETAAIELLRSFHNPEFSRALRIVLDIPVGARKKDLGEFSADQENAIMVVMLTFESIGLMVFRNIVPLNMVDDLLGGVCVECWGRLNNYIQDRRIESGRDALSEWFQWLAERLQEVQARHGCVPAYELYRRWRV